MNKIKIIGNEEKSGINKYLFIGTKPKISLLFLNANLTKIIIYSNIIIIYVILFVLFKELRKNKKYELSIYNNKYSEIIYTKIEQYDSIINKYKRKTIIWPLPNEIKFIPIMSRIELIAFSFFMKRDNIYFEFGSGGSTNIASYYQLKTYSVESDIKWHEKLKKSGIIANYITINLNTSSFGYPGNETNIKEWKKYIQSYKKEYNADIILIDGRFRVACALDIFTKIRNDTLVFIHDYEPRMEYHIIEKYYIKIKSWNSLALFLKRPNIFSIQDNIYNNYLKEKAI